MRYNYNLFRLKRVVLLQPLEVYTCGIITLFIAFSYILF